MKNSSLHDLDRLTQLIACPAARPLRFAGTGVTAAACQLLLLAIMNGHGWNPTASNSLAFVVAAQLNFFLSLRFTWRDRAACGGLGRRWLLYHGSIALMACINFAAFEIARTMVPVFAASLAGIAAGAIGNYVAGDRLVFLGSGTGAKVLGEEAHVA